MAFTTAKTGPQPVCVYAINTGGGTNLLWGCKVVTIDNAQPFGALDTAAGGQYPFTSQTAPGLPETLITPQPLSAGGSSWLAARSR